MTYEHYRFRVRAYGVYAMILWCVFLGVFAEVLWRCRRCCCKGKKGRYNHETNSRYTSVVNSDPLDQTSLELGDDNHQNEEVNQITANHQACINCAQESLIVSVTRMVLF